MSPQKATLDIRIRVTPTGRSSAPTCRPSSAHSRGHRLPGGLFITTARFSQGAKDYAKQVLVQVVLIDGQELALLMIRYGLGVTVKQTYEVKDFDRDLSDETLPV